MTGPDEKFDYLLKGMKVNGTRIPGEESGAKSLDYAALEEAIKEANKKPKLGVYSPIAAALLRYKAIKTPRYSMGSELRELIEQSLKKPIQSYMKKYKKG